MTDGQLLEAFIGRKDGETFDALLHRHGPMVMGVCFRVLRNHHDSEDAFQAAFLVLARKASSVRPREQVVNWLHGVAYRTALKARAMRAKTQVRERQVAQMPEPEGVQQDNWSDLQPVLDEELSRLPDNYRLPLLLCDLEGKSIKEATQQLGWPQGTLAGRLARARKMLAKRLTQRGVVLSGGALAVVLTEKAASASVPLSLAASTSKAAVAVAAGKVAAPSLVSAKVAALMEGVMKGMFLSKLKTVSAVLFVVLGLGAFGGGLLEHQRATGQQNSVEKQGEKQANGKTDRPKMELARPEHKFKDDNEKLQGTWKLVQGGLTYYPDVPGIGLAQNLKNTEIVIDGTGWTGWTMQGKKEKTTFRLDAAKTPKTLEIKDRDGSDALGIYMLGGDDLVIYICGGKKQERPTKFVVDSNTVSLLIYKRVHAQTKDEARRAKPTKKDAAHAELDTWLDQFYQRLGLTRAMVENPDAERKTNGDELQGGWTLVSCKQDGKIISKEKQKLWTEGLEQIIFFGKSYTEVRATKDSTTKTHMQMEYRRDSSTEPKRIDRLPPNGQGGGGVISKRIYSIEGDELRVGLSTEAFERPTGFDVPKTLILTFRRVKQAE